MRVIASEASSWVSAATAATSSPTNLTFVSSIGTSGATLPVGTLKGVSTALIPGCEDAF